MIKMRDLLNELILFHGSKFNFDSFRDDTEFTGTGAQGFGWGVYFTDSKSFAKSFAESETNVVQSATLDGKDTSKAVNSFLTSAFKSWGNKPTHLLNLLKSNSSKLQISKEESEHIINSTKLKLNTSRMLYQVDIGGRDNYLEWSSPISNDQSNMISKQMQKSGYKGRLSFESGKWYKDIGGKQEISKGKDIYYALAGDVGFDQKKASLFLLDAGIDGIKYNEGGTTNYVIFNIKAIKVIKKTSF